MLYFEQNTLHALSDARIKRAIARVYNLDPRLDDEVFALQLTRWDAVNRGESAALPVEDHLASDFSARVGRALHEAIRRSESLRVVRAINPEDAEICGSPVRMRQKPAERPGVTIVIGASGDGKSSALLAIGETDDPKSCVKVHMGEPSDIDRRDWEIATFGMYDDVVADALMATSVQAIVIDSFKSAVRAQYLYSNTLSGGIESGFLQELNDLNLVAERAGLHLIISLNPVLIHPAAYGMFIDALKGTVNEIYVLPQAWRVAFPDSDLHGRWENGSLTCVRSSRYVKREYHLTSVNVANVAGNDVSDRIDSGETSGQQTFTDQLTELFASTIEFTSK